MRQNIPILALLKAPTVAGMAETLVSGDWPARQGVAVAVREHGHGRPLFCVAPEVNTVGYSMLARHLDPGRRVYVLQVPPGNIPMTCRHWRRATPKPCARCSRTGPTISSACGGALATEMTRASKPPGAQRLFPRHRQYLAFYTISRLIYVNRWHNIARYLLRRHALRADSRNGRHARRNPARATCDDGHADRGQRGGGRPQQPVGAGRRIRPARPRRPHRERHHGIRIKPQQYQRIKDDGLGWSKQSGEVAVVSLPGEVHDILREANVVPLRSSAVCHHRTKPTTRPLIGHR